MPCAAWFSNEISACWLSLNQASASSWAPGGNRKISLKKIQERTVPRRAYVGWQTGPTACARRLASFSSTACLRRITPYSIFSFALGERNEAKRKIGPASPAVWATNETTLAQCPLVEKKENAADRTALSPVASCWNTQQLGTGDKT